MNEDEARQWLSARGVSRETLGGLERFVALLRDEATRQNLVAASTLDHVWSRHVVDSAQLLEHAQPGSWIDLGAGAGFPGIVIAALGRPVTLVESRAKRVSFLREAAAAVGASDWVEILAGRVESVPARAFDVISARAFAPLPRLLDVANHLAGPSTLWLLPKGRSAPQELEAVAGTWQGDFRIVPSVTDPDAAIIAAREVRPGKRR